MMNYTLNQKVVLKTNGSKDETEGIIVAIMGSNDLEWEEKNARRFKVRIGNIITDWIPESVIKGFTKQEAQFFKSA